MVDDWDENEELWPACLISSAVVSMGGRCLTDRYCMKPCARMATYNGKVFARQRYAYEPAGPLREGKIVTILPNTGRTMGQFHVCSYDARAHRTRCTFGELETSFAYELDRLVGSEIKRGDETLERRTHVYGASGQLVRTTRQAADAGESAVDFAYNADGSLAATRETSTGHEVTRTFAYDGGGRVTHIETTPDGTVVDYRYDPAGRVIEQVKRGPSPEHVTYAYDREGRLVERAWHDGDDLLTEAYAYDCR